MSLLLMMMSAIIHASCRLVYDGMYELTLFLLAWTIHEACIVHPAGFDFAPLGRGFAQG